MTTQTPGTGETDAAARPARDDLFRAIPTVVELREDLEEGGDGRTLVGHFARFDEWTEIDSVFEGRFMERIARGAFKKTFREQTPKVLFNHGFDPVLGRMILGDIAELKEDSEGAFYRVNLFDGLPDLLMDGLRADAYGASFRFRVIPGRETVVHKPARSAYNPEGLPERTIREAQVFEFGPVTFPAYEGASAGVRSDYFALRQAETSSPALRAIIDLRLRGAAPLEAHPAEETRDAGDEPEQERAEQDAPDAETFRERVGAAIAASVEEREQEGTDDESAADTAPPTDRAEAESLTPSTGAATPPTREPGDLAWIRGESYTEEKNPWTA